MPDIKKDALKRVANSVESFTTDFHKNVAGKEKGNFISSALGAQVVLAMAAFGAQGTTAEKMRKALHLPEEDFQTHLGFQNFIDTFNDVQKVILKLVNKIYISSKITVKDEFLKITEEYFRSKSEGIDVSKPIKTAEIINQWCVEKTNSKIRDIIKADDVTPKLAFVLLNAIYFKGSWKHKFHVKNTEMKPFHIDKATTIKVPTMHITENYFYRTIDELNAQCIKLPFENSDLEMEIIVPREIDGLSSIENNLEKLNVCGNHYFDHEVNLSLPKFKIETTIDLKPHLEKMGMGEIFTDKANFGGISDSHLAVSKVLQKAFIEVNEEGSEAAAVTGMMFRDICMPPPPVILNIDRPFLYNIVFKKTVIFSGRIMKP